MISPASIFEAHRRISPYIISTPTRLSRDMQREHGLNVFLKQENLQVSGSFKPRGGFNKILKTRLTDPDAEFVAPTAGGHGVGLSYAAQQLGAKVHIYMPETADPDRIKDITQNGGSITFFESVEKAREAARKAEQEKGYRFVSAYNDIEMIEGGGTMAVELLQQVPQMDCLVCSVGGGGYLAGMAIVLKAINPHLHIIAVQQNTTPFIYQWFKTGRFESMPFVPSIAEGVGAMVEEDCITLPYIRQYAQDFLLVTDDQIRETLNWTFANEKMYVEPSGIVGLTAIRHHPDFFKAYKNVVTVVSGRNISYNRLKTLID